MIFSDRSKIKSVKLKYPEFCANDAEQQVINDFNELMSLKKRLSDIQMESIKLGDLIKEKERIFNDKSKLFTIEYETYEKDYKVNEINVMFNMSAEINKNLK